MHELHATSGIEVMFEVITGALQLMASNGGSPKPSYNEGYTKVSHPLYKIGRSSSSIYPQKTILSDKLLSFTKLNNFSPSSFKEPPSNNV